MRISLGSQVVDVDEAATVRLYRESILEGDASRCTCSPCKNFALQRLCAYSVTQLETFGKVGVDPEREWEVYYLGPDPKSPELKLYGGWFLVYGEILNEDVQGENDLYFTSIFPATTFPPEKKMCAIHFYASLPWVLHEWPEY